MGVCIESLGGSTFVLSRVTGLNRITYLETEHIPKIKLSEHERFIEWGNVKGEGFRLKGILHDGLTQIELMMFIPQAPYSNIAITKFCPLEDQAISAPGFQLIQDSFSLDSARRSHA